MDKDSIDIEGELIARKMGIDGIDLTSEKDKCAEEIDTGGGKSTDNGRIDLYDFLQCVITAVVIGIMIFVFAFRVIGVDGRSMYSTLHHGDKVIVSGLFYTPKQGDIIILKTDLYKQPLVKRIIATENQTVDIDFQSGIVYVDGQALDEPYTYEPTYIDEGFVGPVTVPEGCVFVMGDNRNDSKDSRYSKIGFIDERSIFGKVYFLLFPGADQGGVDFSRIGSVY